MKNLINALLAVRKEIGTIEKRGINKHHKYKFAQESDVLQSVRPAMNKNQLVLLPVGQEIMSENYIGKQRLLDVNCKYSLKHSSGESYDFSILVSGIDGQDKALPKALSMGMKYAYFQILNLAKGDDPDKSSNSKPDEEMIDLNVPFSDKDHVKGLGAKWNSKIEKWQCYESDKSKFESFIEWKAKRDPEFIDFCTSFGGYEIVRKWFIDNNYPDIEFLPKSRINKLMRAVYSQQITIDVEKEE